MIAKRAKKSANRSLVNTFCYVVDTRKSDLDNDIQKEGKAEQIRISNMGALNLSDALLEMQLLQSLNTRSKSDKNYHLIVSFPPDEKPSKEILEKIEDELIESIGLADHQRISAVHNDTDHYHLHILINKIHPVSYNNVEPYYDKKSLMKKCDELETKFGLTATNHGLDKNSKTQKTEQEIYQEEATLKNFVSENLETQIKTASSWQELHDLLADYNIELNRKGQGLVFKSDDITVKASTVNRDFSLSKLKAKLGDFEERSNERSNRDSDDRSGSGKQSGYDRSGSNQHGTNTSGNGRRSKSRTNVYEQDSSSTETGTETLDSVRNLSRVDVVTNPIGVEVFLSDHEIGHIQQSRANAVERLRRNRNSMGGNATGVKYNKNAFRQTSPLYEAFSKERAVCSQQRKTITAKLQHDRTVFKQTLDKWYQERAAAIRASKQLSKDKKLEWQKLFAAKRKFQTQFNEKQRKQREKIPKVLNWHDYLQKEALNGNTEALKQLRKKTIKQLKIFDQQIGSTGSERNLFIYKNLDPAVRTNGSVAYEFKDGGKVLDRKDDIKVENTTQAGAFMALVMAKEKFGYRPLKVGGTDEFKQLLIDTAVKHNIDIKFEDKAMEIKRQSMLSVDDMAKPKNLSISDQKKEGKSR
ncbi:TraI/MobA(P) family conjugative relaxase [Acinetobacter baumannii]|uniref:TraI/MobA(P) family conjugative relaxase n=1 Tax=Acinetobacter baumannii TaxID=470 RepID=UPI000DF36700|nr:TraI/MobA(P) family conjugative relaxase [Acinetobacter baumannii]RCT89653.1 hypothetical protein DVA68_15740 [Acinetobacter baumannii]